MFEMVSMETKIEVLRKYEDGVTFEEALRLAEGKRLASNKQIDGILQDDALYKKYRDLFYCWTGTLVIYEEPGKPFGEYVKDTYSGWIFDVPKEFQGQKNKALVLEHPDFSLEKGKYDMTFVKPAKNYEVSCVDFPEVGGWYMPDGFGIPNGKKSDSADKRARRLWRRDEASIRPLVRYDGFYGRRNVCADVDHGWRLGVASVEVTK